MISRSPRVLLVDGQPDLRELEALILRDAAYQVVVASATEDPISEAERTDPDVIVLGIRPYETAGWESIDRLDCHRSLGAVPVVAISTAEWVVTQAHAAPNVRATVAAPYDVGELQEAVARALGQRLPAAFLPPADHPVPAGVAAAADVLLRGARAIVLRASERLRRDEPYASRYSTLSVGLLDDLPGIFGAIVTAIQRGLPPEAVAALPAMAQATGQHVRLREKQGIGPLASAQEYRALRDELVDYLNEELADEGSSTLDLTETVRRFDELAAALVRASTGQPGARPATERQQSPAPVMG